MCVPLGFPIVDRNVGHLDRRFNAFVRENEKKRQRLMDKEPLPSLSGHYANDVIL